MSNPFLQKKILVITAHPDDETFFSGALKQVVDSGGEVRLFCATLGERGKSYLSEEHTPEAIKAIRGAELHTAANTIGISSVHIGGFADSELMKYKVECAEQVRDVLNDFAPDVIMGYGADGYTGHADHIAIHDVAAEIAEEVGVSYAAFTLPPEPTRTELLTILRGKRKHGVYQDEFAPQFYTLVIEADPIHKMEVLRCHTSQFPGLDPYGVFGQDLGEHLLTREYFTIEV